MGEICPYSLTSIPTGTLVLLYSSVRSMIVSWMSYPEFSANILGITRMASANAYTPNLALPLMVSLNLVSLTLVASSKDPAPGMTHLSSMAFFTALSPSLTASLICAMVCSLGPLIRIVHDVGFLHPSMNVYLSSPNVTSLNLQITTINTYSQNPKSVSTSSSTEFTATPPQHLTSLSMFLLLALLIPTIPSLANISKHTGSIPFWLMSANVSPFLHTCLLKSTIFWHLSSVNLLSELYSFSLSSALEKKNPLLT